MNKRNSWDEREIRKQMTTFLENFFDNVPEFKMHNVQSEPLNKNSSYRPDLTVDVTIEGDNECRTQTWRLIIEIIRDVYPSLLNPVLAMLTNYVDISNQNDAEAYLIKAVPVVFTSYLTQSAIDLCKKAGVNCVDIVGNGRIVFDSRLYLERIGRPDQRKRHETITRLFVPKSERVLRVLLNAKGASHRVWHIRPLAEEAKVSVGQAARVKAILRERGFTKEDSSVRSQGGFTLTHLEELLKEWSSAARARGYRFGIDSTYNTIDSLRELQRMLNCKLPRHTKNVALSGFLAAERYAPYAASPRITAYVVEDDIIDLGVMEEVLDLEPVESGSNVVLTIPHDAGVLYLPDDLKTIHFDETVLVQAVSPVQAYLDLQRLGGRGSEAAQYLLETYLRPRWEYHQ